MIDYKKKYLMLKQQKGGSNYYYDLDRTIALSLSEEEKKNLIHMKKI